MPESQRRSIYADRLAPFGAFAFGDDRVFANRGRWAAYFRDRIGPAFDGRIVFEIGCFDGTLIARLAAKHPTTGFVGLDWKHKALFTAAERIDVDGLRNVALLRGRGQDLAAMFGPDEVDEILVFHPDPFAEAEHLANRLWAEPFLVDAHTILRGPAATLTLKTDHPGYYAWALALIGLAEPPHFAAARAAAVADPSIASKLIGEPRVRPADLLPTAHRPTPSAAAIRCFDIALASWNAWRDPAAAGHVAGRVFAGEKTLFEERFLRKRQPIYYLELTKRVILA